MGLNDPVEFCSCHFSPPPSVKIPVLQAQEEDFWGGGMKLAKAWVWHETTEGRADIKWDTR